MICGGASSDEIARDEDRLLVAHAVGFEQAECLVERQIDLREWQLGAAVEFALENLRSEPDSRVELQALAQLGDAGGGQREADGVRVAAEADEDIVAAFERFEQMEAGDGAAGAVRLAVFVAEDERGVAGALDDARGENAEDAAMPAIAVDDEAALAFDDVRRRAWRRSG